MTRSAVEAMALAGADKVRLSREQPLRYLTRAAVAGAFIFVGALCPACAPPGSTTPACPWPSCWPP